MRTLVSIAAFLLPTIASAQSFTPEQHLQGLAGSWRGSGIVKFTTGNEESVTCRATNTVTGNSLSMTIVCGSSSLKATGHTNLILSGNALSGQWSVPEHDARGNVGCKMFPSGAINCKLSGSFDGYLSLKAENGRLQANFTMTSTAGIRVNMAKT